VGHGRGPERRAHADADGACVHRRPGVRDGEHHHPRGADRALPRPGRDTHTRAHGDDSLPQGPVDCEAAQTAGHAREPATTGRPPEGHGGREAPPPVRPRPHRAEQGPPRTRPQVLFRSKEGSPVTTSCSLFSKSRSICSATRPRGLNTKIQTKTRATAGTIAY